MTLLRPERERPFPPKPVPPASRVYCQHDVEGGCRSCRFLRGMQQPRKKAGQFALMARGPAVPKLRRVLPDNWGERADSWLWEHPAVHTLAACLLVGGLMWALIWLTLKVARMEP